MYTLDDSEIFVLDGNCYFLNMTDGRRLSRDLHSHTFYEFIFVLSGKCTHKRNSELCDLERGSLVCMKPEDKHAFTKQSCDANVFAFCIKATEAKNFFDTYGIEEQELNKPLLLSSDAVYEMENLCKRLRSLNENDLLRSNKIFFGKLLHALMTAQASPYQGVPKAVSDALNKLSQDITCLGEGITALERLSGYSRAQLTRIMKKYLNTTPRDYVAELRLRYGYNLVAYTDDDVCDIAEKTGYKSTEHFQKKFKRHYGITPSRLRKLSKNNLSV